MKTIFDEGLVQKSEGENYVSYLLRSEENFSPTGYKMMLSGACRGILKCTKVMFNGWPKFVYITDQYRRMDRILASISEADFLQIAGNIVSVILELRENTLLKCSSMDLTVDHIFVDYKTKEIYLIYLPVVSTQIEMEEYEFDQLLRTRLLEWSRIFTKVPGDRLQYFQNKLQDPNCSLKEIASQFRDEGAGYAIKSKSSEEETDEKEPPKTEEAEKLTKLVLQSAQREKKLEFIISQDEYLLGRSVYRADGQISGNMRVGNVHCKIVRNGSNYYVMDLQSRNGTFLNGVQLRPGAACLLNSGDILKLADESFRVL